MVLRKKHNVQEVVVMGIQNLTKRIADSANVTRKGIQRAVTRSFFLHHPHLVMLVILLGPLGLLTVLLLLVPIAVQKRIRL